MKIAVIGRTEFLFDTITLLKNHGFSIGCIITAKEAPEYKRSALDFQKLACEENIPFKNGPKIQDHLELLQSTKADIGISANYTSIFPQSIIDLFPFGVLNAHGGDLPKYRGNACQAWAILNGESRIGLCIHKMQGGVLDSGDIISRDYFPLSINTKITEVWDWMARKVPDLFLESVQKLCENKNFILEKQSNDLEKILRCYPRRPEDGQINWLKSAHDVLRLINACNKPFQGAFCICKGKKMIVWEGEIVEKYENFLAVPGQITKITEKNVEVACGVGKIRITRVEIDNEINVPSKWIVSLRERLE